MTAEYASSEGLVWGGPPEEERERLDREETEYAETVKFNEDVARKARDLKVLDAARERIRAEVAGSHDFTDQFLTRSELNNLPAPDPLIDKVIPRHAYAILSGRDQSFKSFAAIDWACCLAAGKSWQGHAVEQARVLYIAGEGAHGLAKRIAAWENAWGRLVPDEALTIRRTALNMHKPGPAFDNLLEHVTAGRYGLVIVDTLRRVSGAADGNGSEMGVVVDNLDRIKQATANGTVLAVAHTDKGDNDTRGYSGIEDDADVVWHAKRDEHFVSLELRKMKDGPDGRVIHLEAKSYDESIILEGITGIPAPNTTESQLKILTTLRELAIDGMPPTALRNATGLAESTFYRAIKELHTAHHIQNVGTPNRKIWALPALDVDSPELSGEETASDLQDSHHSQDSQPSLPLTPTTPTTLGVGVVGGDGENGGAA